MDPEFTKEQLDAAIAEAVEKATSGLHSKSDLEAAAAKAAQDALADAQEKLEAEKKLALDKERSKREDIEKRLKEANKKQAPTALEGIDENAIPALLEIAAHVKGWNDQKITAFVENVSSGKYQNILVDQKNSWIRDELEPKDARIAELEAELSSVRAQAVRSRIDSPLKDAVIANCNPDKNAQEDGFRRIRELFEDKLDDDGNLIPRQSGEHMGIDPETNLPFTPDTAAKFLARTVFYLKKPSSTSDTSGNGKDPIQTNDGLTLTEKLAAAKTPEERRRVLKAHKESQKAS